MSRGAIRVGVALLTTMALLLGATHDGAAAPRKRKKKKNADAAAGATTSAPGTVESPGPPPGTDAARDPHASARATPNGGSAQGTPSPSNPSAASAGSTASTATVNTERSSGGPVGAGATGVAS